MRIVKSFLQILLDRILPHVLNAHGQCEVHYVSVVDVDKVEFLVNNIQH